MKEAPASSPRNGQTCSGHQMQRPVLNPSVSTSSNAEIASDPALHSAAGCNQHTPHAQTTTDALAQLTLTGAHSWPCSAAHAKARAQLPSSDGRGRLVCVPDQLAVESGASNSAAVRSGDSPSLLVSHRNSFSVAVGVDDTQSAEARWVSAPKGMTQPGSQQVSDEWTISFSNDECIRHLAYLSGRRFSKCRGATAASTEADRTSSQYCESLLHCRKSRQTRGLNLRGRLSICQEKWITADSTEYPIAESPSCGECSRGCLRAGRWRERGIQALKKGCRNPRPHLGEAPAGPRGVAAAVQKHGVSAFGPGLNTPCCPTGVPGQLGIRYNLKQRQSHVKSVSDMDAVTTEGQAAEARRPAVTYFACSAMLGRVNQREKRSLSLPARQSLSDNDPSTSEDRGQSRTASRVASLASAARSCMQRRVSAGTGKGLSKDSRSVHHVFFRAHSTRRRSFQKIPTENGRATEPSENGKTASSRTSSSGNITEKCTSDLVGEYGYHECDTSKVAVPTEVEAKQLDTRVRAAALAEASVTVLGVPQSDSHDRRLVRRIDPAKLLRVSCSKCFSDEQARHKRFAEVNRPIVCEEGSSTRYFRRKGEASGAPGSWPAGDSGSTIISRRLACMLVREVQREVRYSFYPICTRAAMMWVSLLGSILFLSVGTWLTVEDDRHIECRLNYEDETLQEGGSRYSLLSITADLCSGRLHTVRLNAARYDEKGPLYDSSRRGSRRGSIADEPEGSREPGGPSDPRWSRRRPTIYGYAGRRSQLEGGPLPDDPRSSGIRKKFARRHTLGYLASSSAPLSYFFSLSPPTSQPLPHTEETSVISELTGPYIYVYIEMERFYQNDAQVVWSRKDEQLAGKVFTDPHDLKECEPAVTAVIDNITKVLHPCGVLAWNVFTDRFQFLDAVPDDSADAGPVRPLVLEQNQDVLLSSLGDWRKRFKNPPADVRARYRDRVYFWMSLSDNDDGKDMYKTREEAKAELLMDRLNYEEAGEMVENGHFIQWMHTAPFGTWRKFYGRIRGPVKLPLYAYIAVTYDVKQWRGKKAIVLVQPSRFNGRTQFLGSAYLVFGCILAILASYMIWRKWFYVTEEEDTDCAQDLRWRTQSKRRGKAR